MGREPLLALVHKDHKSDFGVSFPDFPGCVTAGATLDEAKALAAEALALHFDGLVEDGEVPSNLWTPEAIAGNLVFIPVRTR